jgi:hypothetical protein
LYASGFFVGVLAVEVPKPFVAFAGDGLGPVLDAGLGEVMQVFLFLLNTMRRDGFEYCVVSS